MSRIFGAWSNIDFTICDVRVMDILQWQTLNGATLLCTENNGNIIILTIYSWIVSNHHYI
ncbi:hypothetical protein BpHYR1_046823 [Brachionus plicatilis]|uniref:Uncharacterized protein n=1 Tax=Brachionus plicatilis TaxID=10195 RepID=A0A3M7S078_BRAPC|nr:hypothetical protein BpHYR1_046823 [Brachionus plicatilis]